MNKLFKITTMLGISLISISAFSQSKVKMNLYYNYASPMGSLKNDFINKGSAYGFGADIMYSFNPKWAVGGSVAYQDFYQKYPRATYKLADGSDISAVLSNSLQSTPIMAKTIFSPLGDKASVVQPYLSAAAGMNILNYSQLLGEFNGGDGTSARFIAQAGAGIKIPVGKARSTGILLGANYNYSPYNKFGIKNANSLNYQAGVQFNLK